MDFYRQARTTQSNASCKFSGYNNPNGKNWFHIHLRNGWQGSNVGLELVLEVADLLQFLLVDLQPLLSLRS